MGAILHSLAERLTPYQNDQPDISVYDRQTGITELISIATDGTGQQPEFGSRHECGWPLHALHSAAEN